MARHITAPQTQRAQRTAATDATCGPHLSERKRLAFMHRRPIHPKRGRDHRGQAFLLACEIGKQLLQRVVRRLPPAPPRAAQPTGVYACVPACTRKTRATIENKQLVHREKLVTKITQAQAQGKPRGTMRRVLPRWRLNTYCGHPRIENRATAAVNARCS